MKYLTTCLWLMLTAFRTLASGGPPPLLYSLPGFIDLTYKPPAYSEIHYDTKDRYALLLNQYLPKPAATVPATRSIVNLSYLDDEKLSYIKAAKQLLEDAGIDTTLLQHKKDPRYYYFHGNNPVCISNNSTSALGFLRAALTDSQLENDVYLQLALIRLALFDLCYSMKPKHPDALLQMIEMLPDNAKASYGAYLQASAHFYLGEYQSALAIYEKLAEPSKSGWISSLKNHLQNSDSKSKWFRSTDLPERSWLKETSLYMVGRCKLIMAQKNWDGYSSPTNADQTLLAATQQAFTRYRTRYPEGLYQPSAAGLARKIAYLRSDQSELNRMLKDMADDALNRAGQDSEAILEAYESLFEYRRFYTDKFDVAHDHPLLLAYHMLDQSRFDENALDELESRSGDFEPYEGLFDYTRAIVQYRQGRYLAITDELQKQKITTDAASLATAALRAEALVNLGKKPEAIQLWRQINDVIVDDVAQLHLAALYAETNDYLNLLSNNGGIANQRIKIDFLHFGVDTDDLETLRQATGMPNEAHKLIMPELLRRHLLTGQFQAFFKLLKTNPIQPFDNIREAAHKLAIAPNDADSLAAIGLFIYEQHLTPDSLPTGLDNFFDSSGLEDLTPYCPACKQHGERIRIMRSAYDYLTKAESIYRKHGRKSSKEAQVLHVLTQCFRGSEFRHRCQWDRVNQNASKQWFDRLHSLYPKSEWAKKTPYYY